MPLRYSYKVELMRLKTFELSLQKQLLEKPTEALKRSLIRVQLDVAWYEDKIKNGKDTGCFII